MQRLSDSYYCGITQISGILKNMEALMQLNESNARDDLLKDIPFS